MQRLRGEREREQFLFHFFGMYFQWCPVQFGRIACGSCPTYRVSSGHVFYSCLYCSDSVLTFFLQVLQWRIAEDVGPKHDNACCHPTLQAARF